LTANLSSRAQKLAAVPESEFEGMVGQWRDTLERENERVTTDLLRAAAKAERKRDVAAEHQGIEAGFGDDDRILTATDAIS